jgi:hypothetical protein
MVYVEDRRQIYARYGYCRIQCAHNPCLVLSWTDSSLAQAYALGIAFRFGLHSNPDSSTLYILYYLFVTLSPCGFIAAEYVLLGRMARWLGGDRHLLITPRRITLVFVLSDVTTFLTQVGPSLIYHRHGHME